MTTMRTARLYGNRDIRIEDVPVPKPGPGECLVEVEWCGICGSDLHEYAAGPLLMPVVDPKTGEPKPINLGHEFCGTIKEVPEGSTLKVGQTIMVDPHCICRECSTCKSGNDQSCANLYFLGGSNARYGGLAEFATVEEKHCLPLPDNVSLEYAAVIEPLAVCQHAVKSAGTKLEGLDVLIVGGGPIGSALIPVLKAHKVGKIFLSEPTTKRREQFRDMVDRVIDPRSEKVGDIVRDLTGGKGADVAFDCAGVQPGLDAAFEALRHSGTFVNVAVWEKPIQIQFLTFFFKEINIRSSCCYNEVDFLETMELLKNGALTGYEKMVTSRISIEDTQQKGFEELINNKDDQVKILISPKLKRGH